MNGEDNDTSEVSAVVNPLPEDSSAKRDRVDEDILSEAKRFKVEPTDALEGIKPERNEDEDNFNDVNEENLSERLKEFDSRRNLRRRRVRKKLPSNPDSAALLTPETAGSIARALEGDPVPSWCQSISDYKPSSLIKSIANDRVHRVRSFVNSGFAYSVISERDKTGKTPIAQALLSCNPTVLGLLLSVENRATTVSKDGVSVLESESNDLNDTAMEDEPPELEYVNCDDKYENLPLFHLPMSKIGVHPTLHHKIAMIYALLLWPRLEDFEHRNDIDDSIQSVLTDVRDLLNELKTDIPNFSLSERSLQTVDIEATDYDDQTVLQRLASVGSMQPLTVLVAAGAQTAIAIPQSIQSRDEIICQYLLRHQEVQQLLDHRFWVIRTIQECIEYSSWKCLDSLVRTAPDITSDDFEHVARFAEALGVSNEFLEVFRRAIEHEEPELPTTSAGSFTGIYTHPDCGKHLYEPVDVAVSMPRNQRPENPSRLEVLLNPDTGILRHNKYKPCVWRHDCIEVCLADILRVHEYGYVELLQQRCLEASDLMSDQSTRLAHMDHDTAVSSESWKAATKAAGCVIQAIEDVCNSVVRNAFCCIRPPGHHIGTYGAVNPPVMSGEALSIESLDAAIGSQGFCLLNNVAIGAAYAKYNFPSLIDRIAIVDFDIHHGNGTEQIVRNLAKKRRTITINGIAAHNLALQSSISIPSRRIWRNEDDSEKVFFCSVHGYDGNFYPATGAACDTPTILNIPIYTDGKNEIRTIFTERICPALINFAPDLILLSAGFDGHAIENIGGAFSKCSESDFRYITGLLVSVANNVCEGRIVSVLEGGYDTILGPVSPFSRSVAAHVDALIHTSMQRTAFLTQPAASSAIYHPGQHQSYSPQPLEFSETNTVAATSLSFFDTRGLEPSPSDSGQTPYDNMAASSANVQEPYLETLGQAPLPEINSDENLETSSELTKVVNEQSSLGIDNASSSFAENSSISKPISE